MNKTTQRQTLSDDEGGFRFTRNISSRSTWFIIIGVLCVLVGAAYVYYRANQFGGDDLQDDAFPSHMQNIGR